MGVWVAGDCCNNTYTCVSELIKRTIVGGSIFGAHYSHKIDEDNVLTCLTCINCPVARVRDARAWKWSQRHVLKVDVLWHVLSSFEKHCCHHPKTSGSHCNIPAT